jgi:CRP/FNR family transcriptional regulator, cyclic AMP receptor protein
LQTSSVLVGVPFARRRDFRSGDFLVEAGCVPDNVYLLRSGQVRCFSLSEDGCEATTAVLGRGQLVGIDGLFGSLSHVLFAQALTPVQTWAMPTARLLQEMQHNPMLLGLVAGALAQRVALAEGLLRDVVLLPVRDRLGDVEVRLALTLGGNRPALSRSQLAGLVQARPETLTRVAPTRGCASPKGYCASRVAVRRRFRAGDVLDNLDAPRGCVNQLLEGRLQIALVGVDKRQVSVRTLEAGDFVGIAGLVGLPPSGLRAVALTDGSLRTIGARELLQAIVADPVKLERLAQQLGRGLYQLDRHLSFAATRTVRQRLLAYLRDLERHAPGGSRSPSHASLARRIGCSREAVTRALRVLEQDGVITRDGRRLRLSAAPHAARPGLLVAQNAHQQGQHRGRVHEAAGDPHDQPSQLLVVEG